MRITAIILDVANQNCYFIKTPGNKFHFAENSFQPVKKTANPVAINIFHLNKNQGIHLPKNQRV